MRTWPGRRRAGVERDVTFERSDGAVTEDVDRAYHAKYNRCGPSIVGTEVNPEASRAGHHPAKAR